VTQTFDNRLGIVQQIRDEDDEAPLDQRFGKLMQRSSSMRA